MGILRARPFLAHGHIVNKHDRGPLPEHSPSNGTLFFGNNIKSKMGILNLIRKIYFNQKTLTKNIF